MSVIGGLCLPFSLQHPAVRSRLAAPHAPHLPLRSRSFPWQPFPALLHPSGLPTLLQQVSCWQGCGAELAAISLLFNQEGAVAVPAAAFATQRGAHSIHTVERAMV